MTPGQEDLRFYQAHIANRGAPSWARPLMRRKHAPHVHEHLDAAINARAGLKFHNTPNSWGGVCVMLRMVRDNQARRGAGYVPLALRDPRTLTGYMLESLSKHGAGYGERAPFYRRILRRMPADVLTAGRMDRQRFLESLEE